MLLKTTCSNPCKLQLLLLLLLSHFSRVQLCGTPKMAAHQAPPSLDSPGKNTGVDCHCLLQCMKVKSESEVTQSCLTLSDPMDCRLPAPPLMGFSSKRTGVGCHCLLRQLTVSSVNPNGSYGSWVIFMCPCGFIN